MQELFSFFNQGWVGSLIGLIGIILGAVGIFSYKISKSIAKPSFQKASLRLLGRDEDNLPKEVTVLFKGNEVNRLTKTTLILWNNGTEVLDGKDVIPKSPICITYNNGDNILSHKILKRTKAVNNFSVVKNKECPHQLLASFDYLDPKDGIVLEILHDSEKKHPEITGIIKGIPKGFIDLGIVPSKQNKVKSSLGRSIVNPKPVLVMALIIGLGITFFGLLPQETMELIATSIIEENESKSIFELSTFFIVLGLLYTSLPMYILWTRRKKYPKKLEIDDVES